MKTLKTFKSVSSDKERVFQSMLFVCSNENFQIVPRTKGDTLSQSVSVMRCLFAE
jgi:hypothetical protein